MTSKQPFHVVPWHFIEIFHLDILRNKKRRLPLWIERQLPWDSIKNKFFLSSKFFLKLLCCVHLYYGYLLKVGYFKLSKLIFPPLRKKEPYKATVPDTFFSTQILFDFTLRHRFKLTSFISQMDLLYMLLHLLLSVLQAIYKSSPPPI